METLSWGQKRLSEVLPRAKFFGSAFENSFKIHFSAAVGKETLKPARMEKILYKTKAEPPTRRITFNPFSASKGKTPYVHAPKLSGNEVLVPERVKNCLPRRRIYAVETTAHALYGLQLLSFVPDKTWKLRTPKDSDSVQLIIHTNCIYPSGPLGLTKKESEKLYSRCICEPICAIYYAVAHRHSPHAPLFKEVNLIRKDGIIYFIITFFSLL